MNYIQCSSYTFGYICQENASDYGCWCVCVIMCVCMCVCVWAWFATGLPACLHVHLSVCLPVCLLVCFSVCHFLYLTFFPLLSVRMSKGFKSVCLPVCVLSKQSWSFPSQNLKTDVLQHTNVENVIFGSFCMPARAFASSEWVLRVVFKTGRKKTNLNKFGVFGSTKTTA